MVGIKLEYNRAGSVEAMTSDCDICKQTGLCLVVDGSDGEYGCISICEACTMVMFVREKLEDLKKMPYYTEDKDIPDYAPVNEDDMENQAGSYIG